MNAADHGRSGTRALAIGLAMIVASVTLFCSGTASADFERPTDPQALRLFEEGNAHYKVRELDAAIEKYKASLKIEESEAALYNVAQAYRQRAGQAVSADQVVDDYKAATWFYRRFLLKAELTDADRTKVEGFIDAMTAEVERRASTTPPTEAQYTESVGAATSSPDESLPGATAPPQPPSRRPTESSTFTTARIVALGVAGVAVGAAGVGVAFGVQSDGLREDAAALCPSTTCADADEANALIRRADTAGRNANIAYGVGALCAVSAVILWLIADPPSTDGRVVAVPTLTDTHAGVGVHVRF